jgi:tRNA pseudouridine38-40 synthase
MRIAMGVEYDGSNYYGWQRQSFDQLPTLQETITKAISAFAAHSVDIVAAGRTDARVHATGQVIHFDTHADRDERAWILGTNKHLPKDIAVKWAREVPTDFHARFSAIARRYQYLILNSTVRSALLHYRSALIYEKLDVSLMHEAAQYLAGEHDFTSFRAAECQAKTPIRKVEYVNIQRIGDFICCEIQANAFLHHMVRNMVGSLIKVGRQEKPGQWIKELLLARDRKQAGATAPACGLYLTKVFYE